MKSEKIKSRKFFYFIGLLIIVFFLNQFSDTGMGQQTRQLDRDKTANNPQEEHRLALVIGNSNYQKTEILPNPVNDATDMTNTLKKLGFEVISGTNQNKQQMENLIRDFGKRLADSKGVGLFFYAGHGIQFGGNNFLIPVDANILAEDEVEYSSVNVNFVLTKMANAKNNLNIVILDACRNNPFSRKWRNYRDFGDKGGLARMDAPTGTLIAYATKPGEVASDGTERNGLYTGALLEYMQRKDVEMIKMLQLVRAEVMKKSSGKQVPFDESTVIGEFYFAGLNTNSGHVNSATTDGQKAADLEKQKPKSSNNNATIHPDNSPGNKSKQSTVAIQKKKEVFFTFEIQKCTKAGTTVICDFTVTNDDSEDKPFEISNINPSNIIDDQGNEARAVGTQVANKRGYERTILLPDVPVKAKITFRGIGEDAKEAKRLVIAFSTKLSPTIVSGFRVEFRNVPLQ